MGRLYKSFDSNMKSESYSGGHGPWRLISPWRDPHPWGTMEGEAFIKITTSIWI